MKQFLQRPHIPTVLVLLVFVLVVIVVYHMTMHAGRQRR